MDDEPTKVSAATLARAIRNKEVSSAEVVAAHLARIAQVNPSLNAVVCLAAESAVEAAREADAALARGEIQGPLHGVPMTIKDNLDTAGVVSTGGTQGRATFVPHEDATVVARLREAGAILLGKTNTPELTMAYETANLVYGRTNHPYDLDRTPGGSSGGAAAILAAGGSPFDIGSDTGGSIRVPAHFCGTCGLKPTAGRVPKTGHLFPRGGPADAMTQLGPLARWVEDLGLILTVISGPDGRDAEAVPVPLQNPAAVEVARLRIAFHTDNGILAPDPEIAAAVTGSAHRLATWGADVVEGRPPGIEEAFELTVALWTADGGAGFEDLLHECGTAETHPFMQNVLAFCRAKAQSGAEFGRTLARWERFRRSMLAFMTGYDAILCPPCAFTALPHGASFDEDKFLGFSHTMTHNLTGWPAAVVRGGTARSGLPLGVQIVARPWREDVALAVAARLESELDRWPPPAR